MNDNTLPIEDWSQVGRERYIDKHRLSVELALSEALETFNEEKVSTVFGSQEKAIEKIIELFISPVFLLEKAPYKNIKLFTQLNYWIKFKTAGNVSSLPRKPSNECFGDTPMHAATNNSLCIGKLAELLPKFNQCVAPDVVTYWLKANRKLLTELTSDGKLQSLFDDNEIEHKVSDSQETRYKVDAAFRYLFLYLKIDKQLETPIRYENKYLVKGENKPQYVALRNETHQEKHLVRLSILKIIDKLCDIHKLTDDKDILTLSLFKVIAKKAVLDVYEINSSKSDKKMINSYTLMLKGLGKLPSFFKEEAL
ncbi:hypothetical protein BM527_13820 [Alteromonas sp. Mex14]|nr:hypothetical protein BM527_13820 [Alteromonas sp. Mex14]